MFYKILIEIFKERFMMVSKHGSEVWHSFPTHIKMSTSGMDFKKKLRTYLIDKNLLVTLTQFLGTYSGDPL